MLDNWRAPQKLRPSFGPISTPQELVQLTGAGASEHD
jgi:hypothetical protein